MSTAHERPLDREPPRVARAPAATMLMCAACFALGCGSKSASQAKSEEAKQAADAKAKSDAADEPPKDDEGATFATPTAAPPPAPEGSVVAPDPWLYVQTCAEPHPCVELTQPEGDAHCRGLKLGGYAVWRLPSKEEAARFGEIEGLEALEGYHWTRTPFEEDMGQVWIVDPSDPQGAPATTIRRDRKPFRIRCVKEP